MADFLSKRTWLGGRTENVDGRWEAARVSGDCAALEEEARREEKKTSRRYLKAKQKHPISPNSMHA